MQLRSQVTRQQILESSQYLFAQSGYDATSVAQICESAGVSKGAFYHHFPSKQAVFLELFENWLSDIDDKLDASRDETDDVPKSLIHMATMVREVFQAADGRLPMFLEFWSQARLDPVVWQVTIAPYRRYQDFFTNLIQDGIKEGTLKEVNPETAARVVVALAVGLLLQSILEPQAEDWGLVAIQSIEMILNGLIRRQI